MTTGLVLVAGGTGRLGRLVVRQLSDRGVNVRVMTRDPKRAADLAGELVEIVHGDVRDPESTKSAVKGVAVVVSAVQGFVGTGRVSPQSVDRDGNINLFAAAQEAGADVVLMSMVGASPDSTMELFRMKYAAERALVSGTAPWTIVRATAFTELWIALIRATAGRSNRPLVFGRGKNPINFVSVRDVAALVERAVVDPETRGQILEIAGPSDLTLDQLAVLAMGRRGETTRIRHVPRGMLMAMAMTVGRLRPELGRQARAALAMDQDDMTFTGEGARDRFRELPLNFAADLVG